MIIILKIIDLNQQITSKNLIILFIETQNSKMTEKLPPSQTAAIFFFWINYIFFIGSLITVFREALNKSRWKLFVHLACIFSASLPKKSSKIMRQHYCGLFVQPDKKSDGAICTNDLISVSLIEHRYSKNFNSKGYASANSSS